MRLPRWLKARWWRLTVLLILLFVSAYAQSAGILAHTAQQLRPSRPFGKKAHVPLQAAEERRMAADDRRLIRIPASDAG